MEWKVREVQFPGQKVGVYTLEMEEMGSVVEKDLAVEQGHPAEQEHPVEKELAVEQEHPAVQVQECKEVENRWVY